MLVSMSRPRQMHLAGFFSAGNVTHAHGAWRHVGATNEFLSGRFYREIARTLERGKFDLLCPTPSRSKTVTGTLWRPASD